MRNFIMTNGTSAIASSALDLNALADGQLGFCDTAVTAAGKYDFANTAVKAQAIKHGMIVLGRSNSNGGPLVIPFSKNDFSYCKMTAQAATTFVGTVTVKAPTRVGEYTLIVIKKGVKFNERNKWTVSVYVSDTTMTSTTLAQKLTDAINKNSTFDAYPVTASVSSSVITVTAKEKGVDYELMVADMASELMFTTATTTVGFAGQAYADYVKDLAQKAAADAGIEYTYQDDVAYLYPNFPFDPLKAQPNTDYGFTIYTLRFAEHREMKTRDEVVHQIVQIAVPNVSGTSGATAGAAVAGLDTVLAALV